MCRDDAPADILSVIRDQDVLVHHPYDSFTTSVEAFIKQAAADPDVLAIKQTLYRTSGDSPIVKALIRAAERGKQVAVLVEVKARFDERANIAWARALERAGVHVVYGLVGLKTHAKIALVMRQEDGGIRRYCHIGTGNYNPRTARMYEDIGLLTSDPELGADLTDIFNYITGYSRRTDYRKILVAPLGLRDRILELIAEQAAAPGGRIVMKMNGLADPVVIDALYEASQAGVRDRPHRPRHLLLAAGRARDCRRTSGCGRSSVASSSTRGYSRSATARTRRSSTSWVRPTSCRATLIAGSRSSRR